MKLGDRKILREIERGVITVQPFNPAQLGSNSYDVRLGGTLAVYLDDVLDCKIPPSVKYIDIPPEGYVLYPGELYLGSTVEYIESGKYLPNIEGKSSVGRLGIFIHVTAGLGDTGFRGHFTLEITVVKPIRIYADMLIGQITWEETTAVNQLYCDKPSAKYSDQGPIPVASAMWKNFASDSNE